MDEKPPNPVGDQGGKFKDQSDEKPLNPIGDWKEKLKDRWQCAAYK